MSAAAESALLPTISDTQRRVALVQAEIGSWYWDFGSGNYSLDSRWCHLLQLDPCPGRDHLEHWARNIHPDDVFDFHRRLEDVRAGSSNRFECEYRILTGDSRWLWMLHRGHVLEHGADGKALRVCGVCIEIDVRKQTEVALQENEARLATALWGARAAFWQWQIGGHAIAMSPLWFAMTGYTREQWEAAPDPWFSRIHPADRERVEQQMRGHLASEQPAIDIEYRIRTGNGRWKWILTRGRAVAWDFDGKATTAIGISLDIHARKEVELHSARNQEQLLQTVATSSADWLALFDRQHRCVFLNRPLQDLQPQMAVGVPVEEFARVDDRARLHSLFEQVMETGEARDFEQAMTPPDERGPRYLEWRIRAVRTEAAITGTAVNITDVTERKRLEREIIEIANREQQRIGSDLHDGLGQELTGIALMLRGLAGELQKQNSALKGDVDEVIGLVNNAIHSTQSLARGLSPLDAAPGGLAEALQTLAARVSDRYGMRVLFKGEGAGASSRLGENAATHLYRIAQEALTNAVRHSLASEITLRLGATADGLQLSINDNGCGFEQRPANESQGLGLKIMRYRAQMLGGDLVLESTPRGGTCVRCRLPLA